MTDFERRWRTACAAAALLLAGFAAPAAVYREATQGDLPVPYSDEPVLVLDAPVNAVIGELTFGFDESDFDSIVFRVPESLTVTGILFQMGPAVGDAVFDFVAFDLYDPLAPPNTWPTLSTFATAFPAVRRAFRDVMPLGPGLYGLASVGLGGAAPPDTSATAAYRFFIFTSPVPEPAAGLLFAAGLLPLAWSAGRRRASARRP